MLLPARHVLIDPAAPKEFPHHFRFQQFSCSRILTWLSFLGGPSLSTVSASRCQERLYQTPAEAKPIVILLPTVLKDLVCANDYEEPHMSTEKMAGEWGQTTIYFGMDIPSGGVI